MGWYTVDWVGGGSWVTLNGQDSLVAWKSQDRTIQVVHLTCQGQQRRTGRNLKLPYPILGGGAVKVRSGNSLGLSLLASMTFFSLHLLLEGGWQWRGTNVPDCDNSDDSTCHPFPEGSKRR